MKYENMKYVIDLSHLSFLCYIMAYTSKYGVEIMSL